MLNLAAMHLVHLYPVLRAQSGYHRRRRRLSDTLEGVMGVVASGTPGLTDDLLLT